MNAGQTLAHYQIIRPLGKGGMGEVYLAEDTKLQRQVALKFLPESVRRDADSLARFKREALAAASLKHPNIATIHALEEADDHMFIAMEYVEGEMLSSRIPKDGMELDVFFDTFIPLADALAHAHDQGRIHRDLKPGNIMITPDGTPKILDFGLALIINPDSAPSVNKIGSSGKIDSQTPTMTVGAEDRNVPSLTQGGQLMGTPHYMSPEQADRKETDQRTDIFSFGIVMYEALTAQRPFDGKSLESIVGRITEKEPEPITGLKPGTPHLLWWTIRKCLEKNRDIRQQTARELHGDLLSVQQEVQSGTVLIDASLSSPIHPAPIPYWRRPLPIVVMLLSVLALGTLGTWIYKPGPDAQLRKFQHILAPNFDSPTISPDGRMIAYISEGSLWIRDLDQELPRRLAGTNGAFQPFWSPLSDYVGYASVSSGSISSLHKVPATGGLTSQLSEFGSRGHIGSASWGLDGKIVISLPAGRGRFGPHSLYTIPAQGGAPTPYLSPDTTAGEFSLTDPFHLPEGAGLSFTVMKQGDVAAAESFARRNSFDSGFRRGDSELEWLVQKVLIHRLSSLEIGVQSNKTGRQMLTLDRDPLYPRAYSSGHLLYTTTTGDLWAAPLSLSDMQVTGPSYTVAQKVDSKSVSVANNGTLLYKTAIRIDGVERQMVWVNRTGAIVDTLDLPHLPVTTSGIAVNSNPVLSPDGKQLTFHFTQDIWAYDLDRGALTRLTYTEKPYIHANWSPQGDRIVFSSIVGGEILVTPTDGSGTVTRIMDSPLLEYGPDWSPDGEFLIYHRRQNSSSNNVSELWYIDMTGDHDPIPFLQRPYGMMMPRFSPDGRFVAYNSSEIDGGKVVVQSFPDGKRRWSISVKNGKHARWSRNGKELFYVEDNDLMVVPIETKGLFRAGRPRTLFKGDDLNLDLNTTPNNMPPYDVSPDGQRFVVWSQVVRESDLEQVDHSSVTIVQNWVEEFNDR